MRTALALFGTDPRVMDIGLKAVHHNLPIAGIWAADHDNALLASLRLGCCAFAQADEPLRSARWVVHSELPGTGIAADIQFLDVQGLTIDGLTLTGAGISDEWLSWLAALGFKIVSEG